MLKEGNSSAFDELYKMYWAGLYRYAFNLLRNKASCEEIIQETFLSLWARRETLEITISLKAYLYTTVKFQILTYMRSEKVREHYASSYASFNHVFFDNSNEESIQVSDLESRLENEVSKLPEKCQQIFRLSRNNHQPVKTIASLLNISHKTVENQLTKALKHLRSSLGEFLVLLAVPFFTFY